MIKFLSITGMLLGVTLVPLVFGFNTAVAVFSISANTLYYFGCKHRNQLVNDGNSKYKVN